jgi:hypothetical protein
MANNEINPHFQFLNCHFVFAPASGKQIKNQKSKIKMAVLQFQDLAFSAR